MKKTIRRVGIAALWGTVVLAGVACVLVLGGCEGKAYDKELKREVTAAEAISLAEMREAKAIRERQAAESKAQQDKVQAAADAKDAVLAAEAEATRKTEEVRLSQQRRGIEYRTKAQSLELEYKIKLADLTAVFDVSQAEALVAIQQAENGFALAREKAGDDFEKRVSAADRRIAVAKDAEAEKLEDNERDTNAKLAEIQRENERYLGIAKLVQGIPGVSAAAGSVGIDTNAIMTLLLGGAVTGGVNSWRGRKRDEQAKVAENSAWEEGYRAAQVQAEKERGREHAAWEEAQRSLLLLHTTPPAGSRIGGAP